MYLTARVLRLLVRDDWHRFCSGAYQLVCAWEEALPRSAHRVSRSHTSHSEVGSGCLREIQSNKMVLVKEV